MSAASRAASRAAARAASRELVKAATKKAIEAATKKSILSTTKAAAISAIKTAAKSALEASKKFIKGVGKTSAKFAKSAKNTVLQSAGDASNAMKKFVLNNPGKVIAGLAVGTAAAVAYDKFVKLNDKTFTIKAIVPKKVGGILGVGGKDALYIEYIDPENNKLRKNDIVVITDSDSKEVADGVYIIISTTESVPSIVVGKEPDDDSPMPVLTKNGERGLLTYKTTFERQMEGLIGDTVDNVGGGAFDIVKNTIDDIGDNLGLGEYMTYIYIFLGFIILTVVIGTLYKLYDMFRSKNTESQPIMMTTTAAPIASAPQQAEPQVPSTEPAPQPQTTV